MATNPDALREEAGTREGRPASQLLIAVAALLLVLLLVWFFFLRSDEEPVDSAVVPAPVTEETPAPEVSEAPDKQDPVETFEVFAPKDPFDPLISPATAGGGDVTGGTTTTTGATTTAGGTTTTGSTTTGSTTTGGTTTTTTTTTSGGGGGGENVGGHRVRVIDVYAQGGSQRAQVQVDGTVYTVDEGERFAENFELVSASGQCATMLYGDDEFTLCEGEEVLK